MPTPVAPGRHRRRETPCWCLQQQFRGGVGSSEWRECVHAASLCAVGVKGKRTAANSDTANASPAVGSTAQAGAAFVVLLKGIMPHNGSHQPRTIHELALLLRPCGHRRNGTAGGCTQQGTAVCLQAFHTSHGLSCWLPDWLALLSCPDTARRRLRTSPEHSPDSSRAPVGYRRQLCTLGTADKRALAAL